MPIINVVATITRGQWTVLWLMVFAILSVLLWDVWNNPQTWKGHKEGKMQDQIPPTYDIYIE